MLSKSKLKFLKSLNQKKFRDIHKLFVVEGPKLIEELIGSNFIISNIHYTGEADFNFPLPGLSEKISEKELQMLSSFKTPNRIIAYAEMPDAGAVELHEKGINIMLDGVSDPGNLGTIIRLADWYGIEQVICSENSVELYNPKVIQSSMGSIFRVKVRYSSLTEIIKSASDTYPFYLAEMEGEPVYKMNFPENFSLIMGSESHGISEELKELVKNKITIPKRGEAESLNVAVATGIICSEIFRSRS